MLRRRFKRQPPTAVVGGRELIAVESRRDDPAETNSMPRDTQKRRATRPASASASATSSTVQRPLASRLAHSARSNDLLPELHQHALDVTGGSCSLLFQHNPRSGGLQATSGFALDVLRTHPWLPGPDEAALVAEAFAPGVPTLVADADRQAPALAPRLNSRPALPLPPVRAAGPA